jgi:hypothetical protein
MDKEIVMNSRTMSGWLLIVAPIICIGAGFLSARFSPDVEWHSMGSVVTALGSDPTMHGIAVTIFAIAFVFYAYALRGISDSMSGGPGEIYAKLGVFIVAIGVAGVVVESGLQAAGAEAAGMGGGHGPSSAAPILAAAQGIGSLANAIAFLGLGFVGIAIVVQKNFSIILGILIAAVGAFGVYASVSDYYGDMMIAAIVSWVVVTIGTGVLVIRSRG